MRNTSLRIPSILVAVLLVAAATLGAVLVAAAPAATVTLRPAHEPTVVETTSPGPRPRPSPDNATRPDPPPTVTTGIAVSPVNATPPDPPPTVTTGTAVSLQRGDRSSDVSDLQRRLGDLGYWLGDADGSYGVLTEQAVLAFQKVEGRVRNGVADSSVRAALAVATRPQPAAADGNLIEVDKRRQVLYVIRDGTVAWTLNTSTGTEKPYQLNGKTERADTPVGHWTVAWVIDGVDVGALGTLYRPRYFNPQGIAVHGSQSVPAFPASHGCVRVTDAAMDWIWGNNLMPIGSAVWVN